LVGPAVPGLFAAGLFPDAEETAWHEKRANRRARFYRLTREGRKQLQIETQDWEQTAAIVGRFFAVKTEDLS